MNEALNDIDTLFSTVAILDDSAQLVERVSYDAYGRARHHRMADLTGDGSVDQSDRDAMRGINWGTFGVGDLNRDGIVDSADLALLDADWGRGLGEGRISATDNIVGYAGYIFNAEMHGAGLYTVRHRHYSPELGRWISRDPLGYVDGMGLYEDVRSTPLVHSDPMGMSIGKLWSCWKCVRKLRKVARDEGCTRRRLEEECYDAYPCDLMKVTECLEQIPSKLQKCLQRIADSLKDCIKCAYKVPKPSR